MENTQNNQNTQDVQPQQPPLVKYDIEARTSSHLPIAGGEPEAIINQDLFTLTQLCRGLWSKVQYNQTKVNLEQEEAINQFANLIKIQSDFLFGGKYYQTIVDVKRTELGYVFDIGLKNDKGNQHDCLAILDYPLGDVIPANKANKVVWTLDRWYENGEPTELNLLRNNDKLLHVLHDWRKASLKNEQLYGILLNLTDKRVLTGINVVTALQVSTTDLILRFIEKLSKVR